MADDGCNAPVGKEFIWPRDVAAARRAEHLQLQAPTDPGGGAGTKRSAPAGDVAAVAPSQPAPQQLTHSAQRKKLRTELMNAGSAEMAREQSSTAERGADGCYTPANEGNIASMPLLKALRHARAHVPIYAGVAPPTAAAAAAAAAAVPSQSLDAPSAAAATAQAGKEQLLAQFPRADAALRVASAHAAQHGVRLEARGPSRGSGGAGARAGGRRKGGRGGAGASTAAEARKQSALLWPLVVNTALDLLEEQKEAAAKGGGGAAAAPATAVTVDSPATVLMLREVLAGAAPPAGVKAEGLAPLSTHLPMLRWLTLLRSHVRDADVTGDVRTISIPHRKSRFVSFCCGRLQPSLDTQRAAAAPVAKGADEVAATVGGVETPATAAAASLLPRAAQMPPAPPPVCEGQDLESAAGQLWQWLNELATLAGTFQAQEAARSRAASSPAPDPAPIAASVPTVDSIDVPPTSREAAADKEQRARRVFGGEGEGAGKLYLAPLTTVGNLPFRRVCRRLGVDITCGEMAMAENLLRGQLGEWARLRRHTVDEAECFGVQIAGGRPEVLARACELIERTCKVDFIDLNAGCPLDTVCEKGGSKGGGSGGAGAALLQRPAQLRSCICAMAAALEHTPLTLKMRTGWLEGAQHQTTHKALPNLLRGSMLPGSGSSSGGSGGGGGGSGGRTSAWHSAAESWGGALAALSASPSAPCSPLAAVTVHGRSRQQRYTRPSDWGYLRRCCAAADGGVGSSTGGSQPSVPFFGNGDIYSWEDYEAAMARSLADAPDDGGESGPYIHRKGTGWVGDGGGGGGGGSGEPLRRQMSGIMVGRGALTKPWLFSEIKQRRHWDISATERLDIVRGFVHDGLEHWGADARGVATTRRFLLEWLSFACRYIPVGMLEQTGERPCLPAACDDDGHPACSMRTAAGESLRPAPRLAWRPPAAGLRGRSELETLLSSPCVEDWLEVSVRAGLPPPPEGTCGYHFKPTHSSKAYREQPLET